MILYMLVNSLSRIGFGHEVVGREVVVGVLLHEGNFLLEFSNK